MCQLTAFVASHFRRLVKVWTLWPNAPPVYRLGICLVPCASRTSLVAHMVKHLPTMRATLVRSVGWEDPLEKEMATHSSTLAWKIPWMEEHGRPQSTGLQRVRHD